MTKPKDFLTVVEAADYAGTSRKTIYNWLSAGLASYKLGRNRRIDPVDIDEFIAKRKQNILI